jgi:3-methyladenine DNA glycosylase AlkD
MADYFPGTPRLHPKSVATVQSILADLKAKGSESARKIYVRHGAPADRVFGVSVANLKAVAKTIKGDQKLAGDLYETGNMDAMYLAGLVADGSQMSEKQLAAWAKSAGGIPLISEYTVPWMAVESPHARTLALKWIKSRDESIAACGWCTYAGIVATTADEDLDQKEIAQLLATVARQIHSAKNRVRHTMNGFLIAVGTYVKPLATLAKRTAKQIGTVSVDMGETACHVPLATAAIENAESAGKLGKKRKTIRC